MCLGVGTGPEHARATARSSRGTMFTSERRLHVRPCGRGRHPQRLPKRGAWSQGVDIMPRPPAWSTHPREKCPPETVPGPCPTASGRAVNGLLAGGGRGCVWNRSLRRERGLARRALGTRQTPARPPCTLTLAPRPGPASLGRPLWLCRGSGWSREASLSESPVLNSPPKGLGNPPRGASLPHEARVTSHKRPAFRQARSGRPSSGLHGRYQR